jgi:hypothetical protein
MNKLSEMLALGSRGVLVHWVMHRAIVRNIQRDIGTCSSEHLQALIKAVTESAKPGHTFGPSIFSSYPSDLGSENRKIIMKHTVNPPAPPARASI